ncbi:alpha/beta hydrolase [Nonomuraea sp. NPDC005983]|uniref:alpha/beta hydrolase family protein n=1 Tax=Nonomuraea sp. NPDC005983 TaxID=3155595 RepID=UPI0033B5F7D0
MRRETQPARQTPTGRRGRARLARLLIAPLLAGLTVTVTAGATQAASPTAAAAVSGVQLQLPRPTGPHAVGRDILRLVDEHRKDPWVPEAGARQLMVSMYYPARSGTGGPAPYMTVEEARSLVQRKAQGADVPAETVSGTRTYAHTRARPIGGRFPLVVLSPGLGLPRASLTGLAEDLASRDYVVALVDHTYESSGTSFPDGRMLTCAPICDRPKPPEGGLEAITKSRTKDVSFVLDQLTGRHPAWRHARMIAPKRIGMAGHSVGGDASAATMAADKRVRAGANLDGTFNAPVPAIGLGKRAFLLMGSQSDHSPGKDHTWDRDWAHLDGWKRWLTLAGSVHDSFTDLPILKKQLGMPGPGELSPQRALELTRAYVGALFDLHLKGEKQPLLDAASPANPEVAFQNP